MFGRKNGAPGKIRTPDPQIRSLVLYPAELPVRGRALSACEMATFIDIFWERQGGAGCFGFFFHFSCGWNEEWAFCALTRSPIAPVQAVWGALSALAANVTESLTDGLTGSRA